MDDGIEIEYYHIVSQTDKAICLTVKIKSYEGEGHIQYYDVWLPLSQIILHEDVKSIEVPQWLADSKDEELTKVFGVPTEII